MTYCALGGRTPYRASDDGVIKIVLTEVLMGGRARASKKEPKAAVCITNTLMDFVDVRNSKNHTWASNASAAHPGVP